MIVRISSELQVTLPKRVLNMLGVGPGDDLEIEKAPDGFILRPKSILDESRFDELDRTVTACADERMLELVTVKTGSTTSWKRDEIYGADGW